MDKGINSEKKNESIAIRNEFHEKKENLINKINEHNQIINRHKNEVSKLEKGLNESRPKLEGCDNNVICKVCDIYSMEFQGSTPNPDKYFIYKCVICNHRDYNT